RRQSSGRSTARASMDIVNTSAAAAASHHLTITTSPSDSSDPVEERVVLTPQAESECLQVPTVRLDAADDPRRVAIARAALAREIDDDTLAHARNARQAKRRTVHPLTAAAAIAHDRRRSTERGIGVGVAGIVDLPDARGEERIPRLGEERRRETARVVVDGAGVEGVSRVLASNQVRHAGLDQIFVLELDFPEVGVVVIEH